jgi:GT2 family glycosyltransferase
VFLVHNRREELRESLHRMLVESDYDREHIDVVVVDNASSDGAAAMVRDEFPRVRLIACSTNTGISGINVGFAEARGDYVLALDDDCYLPPDGLRRAVAAAIEHRADLVSFKVVSTHDPGWVFEKHSRGLLVFVGCAFLARREVLQDLGGFDPELFIWANELEFMLRFFDRGFRHLHLPDVVAQHMKPPGQGKGVDYRAYRINARNWAYIAGKLLRPRDAAGALTALMATEIRDGFRNDRAALRALPDTVLGFLHGLRLRDAVRSAKLSRCYRRNYVSFASPWWLSRPLSELIRAMPREILRGGLADTNPTNVGRRNAYLAERARFYPNESATLEF